MKASLVVGPLAGAAGLMVFLVIHHFWIRPIWFILPAGLVVAGLGGLAIGWAYDEIQRGLPARPWRAPALAAVILAILAPAVGLAELRPSLVDLDAGGLIPGQTGRIVLIFIFELLLTATVMGASLGWLLGRTPRASVAMAVAGFVFALGPGHNTPFLGGTPGVGKGVFLLVASIAVAAAVLVEGEAWVVRWRSSQVLASRS